MQDKRDKGIIALYEKGYTSKMIALSYTTSRAIVDVVIGKYRKSRQKGGVVC